MNRRVIVIILLAMAVVVLVAIIATIRLVPRSVFLMVVVEQTVPGAIPSSSYARNLESGDADLVRESLAFLADRRDPIAVARGIELLESTDDYIWLNAAHYVGACGRQEGVPYLIKALRHTAWLADEETAMYLRSLTGEDFGTDFASWQAWWVAQYPETEMDWTSHLGSSPRLPYPAATEKGGRHDDAATESQPIQ